MKAIFILIGVLIIVGGGATYYTKYLNVDPPVNFRTVPVKQGDLLALVSATGTLEPQETVDVGSQVNGPIKSLGTDPKDPSKSIEWDSQVDAGTLLAKVDPSVYQAQLDQAKANLLQAKANMGQLKAHVDQSKAELNRAEVLLPTHAIAATDYDLDKANYLVAVANLDVGNAAITQCEAALKMAQQNLEYCTIRSPVKGVIIDRRINVGQTVVSAMSVSSLFLIAKDLKHIQVWASVNEADIGRIHEKMPVTFTVDAYPNEVFHGTVYQIRMNATITQNVVTYTVVVDTDNSDLRLYPYLTANLSFQVEQHSNVLKVPNGALRWKPRPQMVAPEYRGSLASAGKPKSEGKSDAAAKSPGEIGGKVAAAEVKTPTDPMAAAGWQLPISRPHRRPIRQRIQRRRATTRSKRATPSTARFGSKTDRWPNPSGCGSAPATVSTPRSPVREVKEGMEVIVGELAPDQAADLSNPFAPKYSTGRAALPKPDRNREYSHGTHSPGKHHQDLSPGRGRRARAQGHFALDPARRNGRADGRLRLRQDDADEHPRLPRPAQFRANSGSTARR